MYAFPDKKYSVIYADPPWSYKVWSKATGAGRSAESHYSTMDLDSIKSLPVARLAKEDAVLLMWATWPTLPQGLEVIKAWGFEYKTCGFDWMKTTRAGTPSIGMGYWTRSNTEPCLLATRGKPKRISASVPMAILEARREHSRKPDALYGRIEQLLPGPYIELFARQQRAGWDCWGNQTTKFWGEAFDTQAHVQTGL